MLKVHLNENPHISYFKDIFFTNGPTFKQFMTLTI